ncbi:UNVERIFIED_CONTAM: hypothetical protein PYX00_004320 [Menopon gallinae]|uniref:Poly [ADP-ribose] polymerase n=1 Tax=Menopon gallinae TaxID=328185 RepID=A0AAW2I461_9NEOP
MSDTLPFRAEYAKSGRAACKLCKSTIAKDELRLAVMVQSPFFDGKQPMWHHFSCFFQRCRPKDPTEIEHFDSLRWEDQEKLKEKINSLDGTVEPSSSKGKGKKRSLENGNPNLKDFTVAYAKSGQSKCKLCEENISKNEIRISKKDYESESALRYGPHERWHHVDCFLKVREELAFFAAGTCLPGYKTLEPDDQKIIKKKIPELKKSDSVDGPSPTKKPKEKVPDDMEKNMKKQNKTMFEYRDKLELLTKPELIHLLEYNKQEIPEGVSNILDRLADGMTFGALKKCEKCGNGQLTFRSGIGYKCRGHVSEWSRCEYTTSKPARVAFKVPKDLKENYEFLNKYKGKVSNRLFIQSSPKAKEEVKDLVQFLIHKSGNHSSDDLKSQIKELGGKTVSKFSENITCIISTEEEINKTKLSKTLSSAKDSDIPVVTGDVFSQITKSTRRDELIHLFMENTVSSWGSSIEKRIPAETKKELVKKSSYPEKSSGMFKSGEVVKKVTLKDGLVVDPDSKLEKVAHVYRIGNNVYSTVLSLTDVQKNKNSYYKLQILESDKKDKYWLFRSWGRIGTTIGGDKLDKFSNAEECISMFESLFEEKTGNDWNSRDHFVKVPGKMMMLEVNCHEEKSKELMKPAREVSPSVLHLAIQNLINLIFDIDAMRKTMLEFELDLVKMPLGKISQKQIQRAFAILSEVQTHMNSSEDKQVVIDATNRFYTLVPHDYGVNNPPLLNNEEIIREKIDVLNSLMEIEIAYKLLQECQETGNSVHDHYVKLNANIIVVERDSDEFKLIETYVRNTHTKTHSGYSLTVEEIFKIDREGEAKKFKKYKKLPNRKLLWHGSRVTNFVGILSQGLRIAPPEAPSTGYMFGKGIYFADRVSKSANYCMATRKNPTGLLLLCEVALGEMHELTDAEYIEKLPAGKHSVKGLGLSIPDPKEIALTPSGAEVPLGRTVDANIKKSSLLYNEYIVYDVSQVKIQYLLKLKFNYKY